MKKSASLLFINYLIAAAFLYMILFCFLSNFLYAQKPQAVASAAQSTTISYSYKIIEGYNKTFGYDIYADKKLLIHQPSIPSLPGNNGFSTKAAAEKVAGLVIKKIQKGEMPPTISIDEIKKLKAI